MFPETGVYPGPFGEGRLDGVSRRPSLVPGPLMETLKRPSLRFFHQRVRTLAIRVRPSGD